MLQSGEVGRSMRHAAVADTWAVAEHETSETAAVTRRRHQAVVCDLRQHGERQMVEIWETHHLREENRAFQIFCIPDWNLLLPVLLLPE